MSEILSEDIPSKRADIICLLLDVAHHAKELLNNFELMVVVSNAFEMPPVRHLKKTWEVVEKKQPGRRKRLKDFVGIAGRNVKSPMQHCQPPLVPYLGVFMQHMVNLHEMPSTYSYPGCDKEHINISKFRNILKVLHPHKASQAKYFNIPVNEDLQDCLRQPTILTTEEKFLSLAHKLEPPISS